MIVMVVLQRHFLIVFLVWVQGTVLDGYALILQLRHVKNDGRVQKKVEKDKSSTKLLVKNVAFEATEKDLKQLFSPFGQVITFKNDNFSTIASKHSFSQPEYEHLAVYYKYLKVFLSLCRLKV